MRILSIDSGFDRTGYAVFDKLSKPVYITSGLIKTSPKKKLPVRLMEIFDALNNVIIEFKPEQMVIEQLFFFKNQKTVIPVAQAQGVSLLVAAQHNIPLEFLTPPQIKQMVTGYGNADKKSVLKMLILTLSSTPGVKRVDLTGKIDDEIDAIACGLAFCHLQKNLM